MLHVYHIFREKPGALRRTLHFCLLTFNNVALIFFQAFIQRYIHKRAQKALIVPARPFPTPHRVIRLIKDTVLILGSPKLVNPVLAHELKLISNLAITED